MFVVGVTMPEVMGQFTLQIVYFITTFSAVAWARDRRLMRLVVGAIVLFMFLWIAWRFVLGSSVRRSWTTPRARRAPGSSRRCQPPCAHPHRQPALLRGASRPARCPGGARACARGWASRPGRSVSRPSPPATGRHRRTPADRRELPRRRRAPRLGHRRQAGAARRVLAKRPGPQPTPSARSRLSREAVTQMRGLLGTLRSIRDRDRDRDRGRRRGCVRSRPQGSRPEPGLADLPALVAERTAWGVQTAYDIVESSPGAIDRLNGPVSLTLYRVARSARQHQSALAASSARVTVRVTEDGPRFMPSRIVDNGRPRSEHVRDRHGSTRDA